MPAYRCALVTVGQGRLAPFSLGPGPSSDGRPTRRVTLYDVVGVVILIVGLVKVDRDASGAGVAQQLADGWAPGAGRGVIAANDAGCNLRNEDEIAVNDFEN
jgi:hypothetical protein